jgi:hypothetical protein
VRRIPHTAIGLALVAASTSACATYHPRASRFISQDADGIHHRDGRDFDVGMSGGSAESLVSGDTRALEYARRYKHLNHLGLPLYLVGLATMVAAPFLLASVGQEGAQRPAAIGAIGLGAGITLGGIALMLKGDAALVDAVNVYNDDVADPTRAGRP